MKMIALGIAMHAYADTWAHSGFAGKTDDCNDVANLRYMAEGTWVDPVAENVALDILPLIGHAQAAHYPDYPWLEWKYRQDSKNKQIHRKNHELFLDAAKNIHARLGELPEATRKKLPWETIEEEVAFALAKEDTRLEMRILEWVKLYTKYYGTKTGYVYHHLLWRNDAFQNTAKGKTEWDTATREDVTSRVFKPKRGFESRKWVKFHKAARKHRNFVTEKLF